MLMCHATMAKHKVGPGGWRALGLLACSLAMTPPAFAQAYLVYYSVRNADQMTLDWKAFYQRANRKTAATRNQFPHFLDLKYGNHPKQALDLYLPRTDVQDAPVVLFIHGGSLLEGDRSDNGYIASSLLAEGAVVAVMSYRLTGDGVSFPAQLDDIKAATGWLHEHVAHYGGDPDNISLSGHSAGAVLAAEAGVVRTWMDEAGIPRPALRAVVAISGKYRLGPKEKHFANYVTSHEAERLASPILQIGDPAPMLFLAVGSTETAYLDPTIRFFETLQDHDVDTSLYVAGNRDHQQILDEYAQHGSPLVTQMRPLLQAPGDQAK
jgi:hypothetical protein